MDSLKLQQNLSQKSSEINPQKSPSPNFSIKDKEAESQFGIDLGPKISSPSPHLLLDAEPHCFYEVPLAFPHLPFFKE